MGTGLPEAEHRNTEKLLYLCIHFSDGTVANGALGRTLLVHRVPPVYLAQSAFHLRKWTDGKAILVHCLYSCVCLRSKPAKERGQDSIMHVGLCVQTRLNFLYQDLPSHSLYFPPFSSTDLPLFYDKKTVKVRTLRIDITFSEGRAIYAISQLNGVSGPLK
ncbi:hypothetical protein KQX54_007312 [Cotesia glomerata]|uniref:Uncharacterized protein n=1 Tax=Cotesia glomerata TaxID=32391 RepID=A0AAV7I7Z3_COTGL|nr:hypothetical protein KQX54_007312 [Cotesia glomerata]